MTTKSSTLIKKDRRYTSSFLILLFLVSVSGFITLIFNRLNTWQQWTYLFHTLIGFALCLSFVFFIINHIRLAQGYKKPGQASIGWLSALIYLTAGITGIVIGTVGQYEAQYWVYTLHVISSAIIVLLLLIHIFIYRVFSKLKNKTHYQVLNKLLVSRLFFYTISTTALIFILTLLYDFQESHYNDVAAQTFQTAYGQGKFLPSQAQTSTDTFLDARRIGRSGKCGACHPQITNEWQSSMHGRSATDPFFQKNLLSLAKNKGIPATRYCGGCHMPIALLSGELSAGATLDQGMHINEGVSCMACHGIKEALSLEGVGSYLFEPEEEYLFNDSDSVIKTEITNYLIKINPRQHKKDMARDILSNPTSCATCHEQYIDKDLNNWGWIKLQSQYQTWVEGPFSSHSERRHANSKSYRCQDCHFPMVDSEDPSANSAGKHRSHRSPAANTAVPYVLGDKEQLNVVSSFLKDDRLTITLHQEKNNGLKKASLNDTNKVIIHTSVSSNRIGHNFPAGTVDLNEPWLELVVNDANDREVYASGKLNKHNQVDPSAHFYFSSLVNRQGKRVWKHDLFNAIGESYVNLLAPGKADIKTYEFVVPEWATKPLKANARLRYRKFNHDYSSWALENTEIELPIIDMAHDEIMLN